MAEQFATNVTFTASSTYSTPELIETLVFNDCIVLVYKRQSMLSNNWGLPNPEIYAEVYSRTDGSMRIVNGRFIPAEPESYSLDM